MKTDEEDTGAAGDEGAIAGCPDGKTDELEQDQGEPAADQAGGRPKLRPSGQGSSRKDKMVPVAAEDATYRTGLSSTALEDWPNIQRFLRRGADAEEPTEMLLIPADFVLFEPSVGIRNIDPVSSTNPSCA